MIGAIGGTRALRGGANRGWLSPGEQPAGLELRAAIVPQWYWGLPQPWCDAEQQAGFRRVRGSSALPREYL